MINILRLPQLAWFETKALDISLPNSWSVEVCNMAGYNRPVMTDDQIRSSITNLIGMPPIREAARGKNEVAIIFDDITRVTRIARIVPFIIEELLEAGIPDSKVRFIAATGTHAPMNRIDFAKKLGKAALARFPVYNHNCFDNCTYVGTTSYGTKVFINTEFMQCDFKIAVGSIASQLFTVFTGGAKMILPGVASIDTIMANHSMQCDEETKENYDKNPYRLDMNEAADLAGLDVSIDNIVNMWGDSVAIFAGALKPAHAAGVQEAKAHYLTPRAKDKDIVIVNTFAKVSESAVGARNAFPSVSHRGGDVVLICNAPQGQVVHYLGGPWGRTIGGKLRIQIPIPEHVNRLILYTEYPDHASLGWFKQSDKILMMDNWDDVLQVLQQVHGDRASVAVYPNADIQYFG